MKQMSIIISTILMGGLLFFTTDLHAQFDGGADIVSRYMWRGQLLASSPSIQPTVSYTKEGESFGIEVGAWGSYALNGNDGNEADLYLTASFKDFGITFTDYFFPTDALFTQGDNYFDYDNHVLELGASYDGPVSISVYMNLMGDADDSGDDLHSFYGELGYSFGESVDVHLGVGDGWYSSDTNFDVVNVGVTYTKELKFSETFSLPVFSTLAVNPSIEKIFIVVGMSF
jgi:hypothetical protein